MKQDKWYVNMYGSNDGRVYVGPLGATCGVAEVHTTAGREQALRDAETIVDAVNSVEQLREQNRVLASHLNNLVEWALEVTKDWTVDDDSTLANDLRMIWQAQAALTVTSQEVL